jgi:RNA polymerase sigma factor (sigma-70 family)
MRSAMEPTDRDLMLAVRNGDAEKFGLLFDRYHQSLFGFFYRLTGDAMSSEDLVQDVFLRMLKYRRTFRADSEFRAWMYQIARTARIDRFKKHQSQTLSSPEFDKTRGAIRPDQHFEDSEKSRTLQRALLQLSDEKRELLVLSRFQEMNHAEIAELLGIEVGTVKVRVHRAMKELRDIVRAMSSERQHAM